MYICKRCNRSTDSRLMVYERVCCRCVTQADAARRWEEIAARDRVVRVEEFVATVRSLHSRFQHFHLATCYCGLPSWQQPCYWCGYYPMHGYHNSHAPRRGAWGLAEWLSRHEAVRWRYNRALLEPQVGFRLPNVDTFLQYASSAMGRVSNFTYEEEMDAVLDATRLIRWPSPEDIWSRFSGIGTDAAARVMVGMR